MGQDTANVTIHIDETLDHARLQAIADSVRQAAGVKSVAFHDEKPHLILVDYDPSLTSSNSIYEVVTGHGVHAEMIGM